MPMTAEEARAATLEKLKAAEKEASDGVQRRIHTKQLELDDALRRMNEAIEQKDHAEATLAREREVAAAHTADLENRVKVADQKAADALMAREAGDLMTAETNQKATLAQVAKAEADKERIMATQRAERAEARQAEAEKERDLQSDVAFRAEAKAAAEAQRADQAEKEHAQTREALLRERAAADERIAELEARIGATERKAGIAEQERIATDQAVAERRQAALSADRLAADRLTQKESAELAAQAAEKATLLALSKQSEAEKARDTALEQLRVAQEDVADAHLLIEEKNQMADERAEADKRCATLEQRMKNAERTMTDSQIERAATDEEHAKMSSKAISADRKVADKQQELIRAQQIAKQSEEGRQAAEELCSTQLSYSQSYLPSSVKHVCVLPTAFCSRASMSSGQGPS